MTTYDRRMNEWTSCWCFGTPVGVSALMLVSWHSCWCFSTPAGATALLLSHPDSRSDPIGGSELSSGCETIYWDSLPDFFFKPELVPVGMAHTL